MPVEKEYAAQLRENRPIEAFGVTFHPLTVRDFALFQNAKPAMELMLSSLPPKLARLSWFACLQEMDAQAAKTGTRTDYVGSVLLLMAKALRLETQSDPQDPERICFPMIPLYNRETGRIASIQIGYHAGTLVNAGDMGKIREILAAQNGYEIPNENWNPELVRAQQYTRERKAANAEIDADFEALVYSVARGAHVRPGEIWGWTLREFFGMEAAIDREIHYRLYTAAEATGTVTFKHGNPYPSWKFNRKAELPGDFQNLAELDAGAKGLLAETNQNKE